MSTAFDLATANTALAVLKRVYEKQEPMIQLPEVTYYLKKRKRTRRGFGAGLYDAIQTSHSKSFGIRNTGASIDNEDLPDTNQPTFENPNWDTSRSYLRLLLTGKASNRALSGSQEESFLRNINFLVQDIQTSYMKDTEFRCLNASTATGNKTGCRGILNNTAYTAAAAVTFTLDTTTSATHRRYKLFQGFEENQMLDVYSKTTWTKVGRITVTSIDEVAGTFVGTLDNDLAGTADEWYLFNQGDHNRDLNGIGDIIDAGQLTTSLGGVPTSGKWAGYRIHNGGALRDFAPAFMDEASLISIKRNGGKPTEAWMSFGMKQQLMAYLQRIIQTQSKVGNKMPVKVNPAGDVEYWGPNAMMYTSTYAPAHEIDLIQGDGIVIEEQEPLHPLVIGRDGGREAFWQRLPGKDTWEAVLVHELQQRTRRRNVHVKVEDLNQPSF